MEGPAGTPGMGGKDRGEPRAWEGLLQRSACAILVGCEDVNGRQLLLRGPAMRAVAGRKALERDAAGPQAASRFETETLFPEETTGALLSISHAWAGKAMRARRNKKVILDTDSSESPVHGGQEGSA